MCCIHGQGKEGGSMPNYSETLSNPDALSDQLVSNIQGGVIICRYNPQTTSSRVLYMSEGWTKLTGYTMEEINLQFDGSPQAIILPDDAHASAQSYMEQSMQGNFYELQYRLRHKDGSIRWAIDRGAVTPLQDGTCQNQSILTDITPMKENEEQLRLSEARFRIATQASRAAVFEFDLRNNRYVHIENAESIFGQSSSEVICALADLHTHIPHATREDVLRHWYHPDDVPLLLQALDEMQCNGSSECEARLRQADDSYLWCKLYQALVGTQADGDSFHSIGYMVNNDAQHKQTERLLREAQSDPLTGLLNKNAIRTAIEETLSCFPAQAHALLVLDVDNFKGVNDSLGHLFGDAVLMETSSKLRRLFRHDSLVGRIGGDEFLVLIEGDFSPEQAAYRAAELCRLFRHTYTGEKADYSVSCSVGIALAVPGDDFDSLFAKADAAMYQAKADGKDRFILYSSEVIPVRPTHCASARLHKPATSDSGHLQIKERIFELLYSSLDFTSSVNMILALLGERLDAVRVYIFETPPDDSLAHLVYEWHAGPPTSVLSDLSPLSLDDLNYYALFDDNDIFYCPDIHDLSHPTRALFLKNGVRASFQVAMRAEGRRCGFIGYDLSEPLPNLSEEDAGILRFAAKLTATFILKKRAEENAQLYTKNKVLALDQLPCPIYVIDEAYRLHYMNDVVLQVQPDTKLGQHCHEAFMCSPTPCEDCPAKNCQDAPCSRKLYNPHNGLWMISSASTVPWSGRPNMRLICCQVLQPCEMDGQTPP